MGAVIRCIARVLFLLAFVVCVSSAVFFAPKTASAAASPLLTYQARITDSAGNPVADGNYSVVLSLYTGAVGGVPVWTAAGSVASPSAVTVHATSSLVTVNLGDTGSGQNPLSVVEWSGSSLYLGVTIGSDSQMSPRRRVTSVPQAFYADTAGSANSLQGMYASSSAASGAALFTIHQTTNDAATSDRTALEVRSGGTSNEFDYLIRGVNSDGTTVFSLNRGGTVTSTNLIATAAVQAETVSSTAAQTVSLTSVSSTFVSGTEFRGQVVSRLGGNMELSTLATVNPLVTVSSTAFQLVGNLLFVQGTSTIGIIDVSDPASPQQLSSISTGGRIGGFLAQGKQLYVVKVNDGSPGELVVYNYRSPQSPSQASWIALPELTSAVGGVDVLLRDQVLYLVAHQDQKLLVVDARNPLSLTVLQQQALTGTPVKARIFGSYLMVLSRSGSQSFLYRTDIYNPLEPGSALSSADLGNGAVDFSIRNAFAYVSFANASQVAVVTLNETLPRTVTTLTGVTGAGAVFENGGLLFAYGSGLGGFRIYNTASSTNPVLLGVTSTIGQVRAFEQVGSTLIVGTDAAPYISFIRLPGIVVNGLQGGTGSFGTLGATGLIVGGDARVEGSLGVGTGGLYVAGTSRFSGYSSTGSAVSIVNPSLDSETRSWGLYTDRLLAGEDPNATGTVSYVSVFGYSSSTSHNGVCLDNTATASTCPEFNGAGTIYSLIADDAVGANAFDLAERYEITGDVEPGDVLVLDRARAMYMKKSAGREYDPDLAGVVSTRPGFVLGVGNETAVALVGRVPVKVTVTNGSIAVGDPLTSSLVPGRAMKATRAGTIIGRALQPATEDGIIEVYLQPGFDATSLLRADGSLTTVAQDLAVGSAGTASSETQSFDSKILSFLGSAWNGAESVVSEFRVFNDVRSASSSLFTVSYASTSLFTINENGSVELVNDIVVGGKLYPSAKGHAQRESYLFVDDTEEGARYISTNADGWQSMDGYDYAERYASPDALEPGDVVTVRRGNRVYVQRSLDERSMVVGIVSTKPGFIAGRPQDDAFPIALAGRVPTKVSSMNGAIQAGDVLAPSSIPGVAVKAVHAGPMVGVALEDYVGNDVGSIEVFVNPGWWGGQAAENTQTGTALVSQQGFAQITMGETRVKVHFDGFTRYPNIQLTPYTQIESGWWIQDVGSEGFTIVLGSPIGRSARFAWQAREVDNDVTVPLSSGRSFAMDPFTGELRIPVGQDETTPPKAPTETSQPVAHDSEDPASSFASSTTTEPEVPTPSVEPLTTATESVSEQVEEPIPPATTGDSVADQSPTTPEPET